MGYNFWNGISAFAGLLLRVMRVREYSVETRNSRSMKPTLQIISQHQATAQSAILTRFLLSSLHEGNHLFNGAAVFYFRSGTGQ